MRKLYSYVVILTLIFSSCSTSSDVVSSNRIQKRKYTKGLNIKKSPFKGFNLTRNNSLVTTKHVFPKPKVQSLKINKISKNIAESKQLNINEAFIAFNSNNNDPFNTNNKSDNFLDNDLVLIESTKTKEKTQKFNEVINEKLSAISLLDGETEPKAHWAAITGMICGILGLLVAPLFFSTLGIIFGGIGISKIKKNPEKYKGRGMAVAGLVTGIIGIVVIFLLVAIVLALYI